MDAVDPPATSSTFCWLKGHMRGIQKVKVERTNKIAVEQPAMKRPAQTAAQLLPEQAAEHLQKFQALPKTREGHEKQEVESQEEHGHFGDLQKGTNKMRGWGCHFHGLCDSGTSLCPGNG